MCWRSKHQCEIMTAEKDIKTFKICFYDKKCPESAYKFGKYTLGEKYFDNNSEINITKMAAHIPARLPINKGFHSYAKDCHVEILGEYNKLSIHSNLNNELLDWFPCYGMAKYSCTIPKGSKYIVNENGEYVSDTIIVERCTKKFF